MRYAFCCIFREAWYNMDVGIEWAMLIAFNRRKKMCIRDRFIYKVVKEGARAREYEDALQWLVDARLVHKVYRSRCV